MSRLSTITAEKLEELTTTVKAKAFLGREFLTWLWYEVAKTEDLLNVASLNYEHTYQVRLWIDDRVVLESLSTQAHCHTIKGGDPARSPEANIALKQGKTVKEMKLGLEIDGAGPYLVTLSSDGVSPNGLSPRSLQLPKPEDDEEQVMQPLTMRLEQIQAFTEVFDSLFEQFMDQRTQPGWEKQTLASIREWIKEQPLEHSSAIH